jgi:hypothetical protein
MLAAAPLPAVRKRSAPEADRASRSYSTQTATTPSANVPTGGRGVVNVVVSRRRSDATRPAATVVMAGAPVRLRLRL